MIVARQYQDAAVRRCAGRVCVLEDIPGAIDAGTFGVPHGEDAVVLGAGKEIGLLASPHRRGGEILVDARLEADVALLEKALRLPQILIEPAERRTAISRDETSRIRSEERRVGKECRSWWFA